MPTCRIILRWTSFGLVLIAGAGCQDPMAQRMTVRRQQKIQSVVNDLSKREAEGAVKVAADSREIQRLANQDAAATRQNRQELSRWVDDDVRRWNRRQHEYPVAIQKEIHGKPENIRHTAIWMFF